jgi:DDE superfamily endonuclease
VREVREAGLVASIGGSTLWRRLHQDAIRPWYHRSWIFPKYPDFAEKAGRLLETRPPYNDARRVFWIVDNCSVHRGQRAVERLRARYPRRPQLQLVHAPTHASWLNQVEIYFSIVQRKVLMPNDFRDLDALAERLPAFQYYWESTANAVRLEVHAPESERPSRQTGSIHDGLRGCNMTPTNTSAYFSEPHRATEAGQQESGLNHFKGNAVVKPEASLALVWNAGAQRRVWQIYLKSQYRGDINRGVGVRIENPVLYGLKLLGPIRPIEFDPRRRLAIVVSIIRRVESEVKRDFDCLPSELRSLFKAPGFHVFDGGSLQ